MLPFVGVIVFTGIYPEADARSHRAERQAADRPRQRQRRTYVEPQPVGAAP